MAQDVISTLFGITPRNTAFDKYAQDQMIDFNKAGSQYEDLGRANIERANALVQNAGTNIGVNIGRLLGGQTPQMAEEQRVQGMLGGASLQDPEQLMMAAERFAQAGDLPRAKALQDAALEMERKKADIARLNSLASGKGSNLTGPERMAREVASVRARQAAGEVIPPEELLRAQLYAEQLYKKQFFKMEDGSIISVDKNDFGRQAQALRDGGVEIQTSTEPFTGAGTPAAAPATGAAPAPASAQAPTPAARPTGGATVIETPVSIEQKKKQRIALQNNIDTIQSDLTNIDEALAMVTPLSTGLTGEVLSFFATDAKRLRKLVSGIDAAKVFNELTKLKEASKTGASGLGQVTEREISLLMNRIRVLDPGGREEDLIKDLKYIADAWKNIQDKIKADLEGRQPSNTDRETATPPAGKSTQYSATQEADIAEFMAANPGKSREATIKFMKRNNLIK